MNSLHNERSEGEFCVIAPKKHRLKTVLNTLINILVIISISLLGLSIYTVVKNEDTPEKSFLFGYKPVYVLTGSMEPTMMVDSLAIVKQASFDDVKVNDIIMYEIDDKMITHRIVEKTQEGIRTKGDNNNVQDAYLLTEENIKGKVVYTMNWVSNVVNTLKAKSGRIKYVYFPLFVIIIVVITFKAIARIINGPKKGTPIDFPFDANDPAFVSCSSPKDENL